MDYYVEDHIRHIAMFKNNKTLLKKSFLFTLKNVI